MAEFADIARRVRSENWGLRLLRQIVRAEPPVSPSVTDNELCVYAGLLIKVGALNEAKQILEKLDQNKNIQALIFLSQIAIAQWNYREAAPLLRKAQKLNGISDYQKCITQVNLAGALIFLEKFKEAKKLLPQILARCLENKWDLLYGNALEISAQLAVRQQDWPEANRLLNQAEAHSGQHTHYLIFIEKWRTLAELFQTKPNSLEGNAILKKIEDLRSKAQKLKSWESVRDFDYHISLYLNHQNLLLNVYFGTPHDEYKKRIERICKNRKWKIPSQYYRKLSDSPTERFFDLNAGRETGPNFIEALKPGQMLHRLLNILATDFYKPFGVGELFSQLFAGEYFNPDISAARVSQAVKQLRQWLITNQIPIDIIVENNRHSLQAHGPYAFKISRKKLSSNDVLTSRFEVQLNQLREKWPYKSFSTSQACEELGLSPTSLRGLLKKALKEERIYQFGAGRSILYRFEK